MTQPLSPPPAVKDPRFDQWAAALYKYLRDLQSSVQPGGSYASSAKFYPVDGEDGHDGLIVPGPRGLTGPQGAFIAGMDGVDGEPGMPIPGVAGASGATGATGPQGSMGFMFDGEEGPEGPSIPGPVANSADGMAFTYWNT